MAFQHRRGPLVPSQLLTSLGFTRAYSWTNGFAASNLFGENTSSLTLPIGVSAGVSLNGTGVSFAGTADNGYVVSGDPFNTKTSTYLWIDNGGSGVITSTINGRSNAVNNASLQIRLSNSDLQIIRTNQAVDATFTGIRKPGLRNVNAISIAGENSRIAAFSDGLLVGTGTSSSYLYSGSAIGDQGIYGGNVPYNGILSLLLFAPVAVPDQWLSRLTQNPDLAFVSPSRRIWVPSSAVVTAWLNSDVITTGWSSTGANLYGEISESVANDATAITGPLLGTGSPMQPYRAGLTTPIAAGPYAFQMRAYMLAGNGSVRFNFLDAGNNSVGASAYQPLTTANATYSVSVTLTGTATQVQIESMAP